MAAVEEKKQGTREGEEEEKGGEGKGGENERGIMSSEVLSNIHLVTSRWYRTGNGATRSQRLFCVYRILIALYWSAWLIYCGIDRGLGLSETVPNHWKWFIFLTHWTAVMLAVYLLWAAALCYGFTFGQHVLSKYKATLQEHLLPSDERDLLATQENSSPISGPYKVCWYLHNLVGCATFYVMALYWFVIYTPDTKSDLINYHIHGVNFLIMLVDSIVSATPYSVWNAGQPMGYMALYGSFTYVYWAYGGTNVENKPYIYPILDYADDFKDALKFNLISLFLIAPGMHLIMCAWNFLWNMAFGPMRNLDVPRSEWVMALVKDMRDRYLTPLANRLHQIWKRWRGETVAANIVA
ncbi:hypothetical protein CBR_g36220 [Chara braunii]|uniref:Uncharacterized protein n=1 Tax=Chara braunii TaxID=69332 RepID=A0A388LK33_CHABU|nr:hypothetical protein CBR_g36220 [Chara braunii]|eukprot:GBG82690.1 hypothetical protein CBR_g36220 [Chara braunii]